MRKIGVVTGARSDYGACLPILRAVGAQHDLALSVIATGMHLSPEHGHTVDQIEADGFAVEHRVEMLIAGDTAEGVGKSMARGTAGFAALFGHWRPDILVLIGDRFEIHAAAVAALPFGIPVAHIHGGEVTIGAMDDALRHSITKLSHLHFATTPEYGRRIRSMGEEAWRVTVSGAPALDNLLTITMLTKAELEARIGLSFDVAPLLVTYHPVTLEAEDTERQVRELLASLGDADRPIIFTQPNADQKGRVIETMIRSFVGGREKVRLVENLGNQAYLSLLNHAAAMVGNSSSGILEAPSFALPVVNIGSRQAGRDRPRNVIDCGYDRAAITEALEQALSRLFREGLQGMSNPFGDGHAAERIAEVLRTTPLGKKLLMKKFDDAATLKRVS